MIEFPFRFDPGAALLLRLAGIRPSNSRVILTDGDIEVEFGRWRLATPISNIAGLEITEDYRFYRAIGIRGSFVDGGVTFGTSTARGLCIKFVEPVPGVIGRLRHPAMTVTVADIEGLATELRARGVES